MKYFAAACALALSAAVAYAGDKEGNGGSPALLRIQEYINTELKNDALAYMSKLQLDSIANPIAKEALKRMIEKDVVTDIRTSKYDLQESCKAIGGQDAAGAINGDLGGVICFSPKSLAELNSTKAEIVGLAIHEHAHHFGYDDKDYAIYHAVYQAVKLANPAWSGANPGGTPSKPPAKPSAPTDPNTPEFQLYYILGDWEGRDKDHKYMLRFKKVSSRMIRSIECDRTRYYSDDSRMCLYSPSSVTFYIWDSELKAFAEVVDPHTLHSYFKLATGSISTLVERNGFCVDWHRDGSCGPWHFERIK